MFKLIHFIPILAISIVSYSSCQRPSAAAASNASPCFAILSDDGFHDLVCDGEPIKQRPGPAGEKGERGPAGGQGPKGDPGDGGRAVVKENECTFELPTAAGNRLTMFLTEFIYSDRFFEIALTLKNEKAATTFRNSSLFKPDSSDLSMDLQEFQVKLTNDDKAILKNIANGVSLTFPCVRD